MKLNYTRNNRLGILNGSTLLDVASPASCTMTQHKNVLYCVYLIGGKIRLSSKQPSATGWNLDTPTTGQVSTSIPGLVSFNNQLVMVYSNTSHKAVVCRYDETTQAFIQTELLTHGLSQTPTFAVLNGRLHMFYKHPSFQSIFYTSTADLIRWSTWKSVEKDHGHNAYTWKSPVATQYQNAIHLIYQDWDDNKVYLLKSDGENWTSNILLIDKQYDHSPGLTVHNGLLKLIFLGKNNRLDQYTYDGNAVSPVITSSAIQCGSGSPGLAVQDGGLVAAFPPYVPPATPSTSRS